MHLDESPDPLLLALGSVESVGAGLQHTGVDADERQGSDERIGHDLEGQGGECLVVGRLPQQLDLRVVDVRSLDVLDVRRGWQVVDHGVKERLDSLVLEGGSAAHRHEHSLEGSLPDEPPDLLLARDLTLEIHHHGLVVHLAGGLDELLAPLLGLSNVLLADRVLVEGGSQVLSVPGDLLHLDQVNHSLEVLLGADGDLDQQRIGPQVRDNHVAGPEVVGAHAVHLVDEADPRNAVLVGLAPDGLGLRLHAGHGIEDSDSAIKHAQRTLDLEREVDVPRGVDDVDAVSLPRSRWLLQR